MLRQLLDTTALSSRDPSGNRSELPDLTESDAVAKLVECANLAYADNANVEGDDPLFQRVGALVGEAASRSAVARRFLVDRLDRQAQQGAGSLENRRARVATLLIAAEMPEEALRFLPPLEQARRSRDLAALDAHAWRLQVLGKRPGGDSRPAWSLSEEVRAAPGIDQARRGKVLRRMIELLPSIDEDTGRTWLRELLVGGDRADRAALESMLEPAPVTVDPRQRKQAIANPETSEQFAAALADAVKTGKASWGDVPRRLARRWIADASRAISSYQENTNNIRARDRDGLQVQPQDLWNGAPHLNSFRFQAEPLLRTARTAPWVGQLDEETSIRVQLLVFRLRVELGKPTEALAEFDGLASAGVPLTVGHAEQLLEYWRLARLLERQNTSRSGSAIQARNLRELGEVVSRLRRHAISPSDRSLVMTFGNAHVITEVFHLDDIALVFGPVREFPESRLLELAEHFHDKLVKVWRRPTVQNQVRSEIQRKQQVARGYEALGGMIGTWSEGRAVPWQVALIHARTLADYAAFLFDENGEKKDLESFVREKFPDQSRTVAEYSRDLTGRARALFRTAAEGFSRGEKSKERGATKDTVFTAWFVHEFQASRRILPADTNAPGTADPFAVIRDSIATLPPEVATDNLARFAAFLSRTLYDASSGIGPDEIHPFLQEALKVLPKKQDGVEDARRLFAYQKNLARQVRFQARLDGDDRRVGVGAPFGLVLSFRHTWEIEDQQGGFNRYLHAPQPASPFGSMLPGYGLPGQPGQSPRVIKYQNDFVKIHLRPALEKAKFEVIETRFHEDNILSHKVAGDKDFPRETPYAYVLLKATDPTKDEIPSIRFDLDYHDGYGDVILPAQTEPIRLDLSSPPGPRPVDDLILSETLSCEGPQGDRLRLEVSAKGTGALPDRVGDLVEIGGFGGQAEAAPVVCSGLDPKSGRPRMERNWSLTFPRSAALQGGRFWFPQPKPGWVMTSPVKCVYRDPGQDNAEMAGSPAVLEPMRSAWEAARLPLIVSIVAMACAASGFAIRRRVTASVEITPTGPSAVTREVTALLRHLARDEGPLSDKVRQDVKQLVAPLDPANSSPVQEILSGSGNLPTGRSQSDGSEVPVIARLVEHRRRNAAEMPAKLVEGLDAVLPAIERDCFAPAAHRILPAL